MFRIDQAIIIIFLFSILAIPFFQIFFSRNASDFFLVIALTFLHYTSLAVFFIISQDQITDSLNYFLWAEESERWGYSGTSLVVRLVGVFRSLGLNDYLSISLFFCTLSHIGILALLRAVRNVYITSGRRRMPLILSLLFFLPGFHLWTSPIGKDSLSAFLLGVGLYPFLSNGRVLTLRATLCLSVAFLIRPQLAAPIILGLSVYLYCVNLRNTSAAVSTLISIFYFVLLFAGCAFLYMYFLDFIQKYSTTGFSSIGQFLTSRAAVYQESSSGLDLSSVPIFARPLLFLFGLFPWKISNLQHLATFLEGAIILSYSVFGFVYLKRYLFLNNFLVERGSVLFFAGLSLIVGFSLIAGNAGLAARLRTIPALLMLCGVCVIYSYCYRPSCAFGTNDTHLAVFSESHEVD